jgi:hypothetical protein
MGAIVYSFLSIDLPLKIHLSLFINLAISPQNFTEYRSPTLLVGLLVKSDLE